LILKTAFPDIVSEGGRETKVVKQEPTKEFLTAVGLLDFYDTRTKSFNRGNMV
jgi:hypothetical protein